MLLYSYSNIGKILTGQINVLYNDENIIKYEFDIVNENNKYKIITNKTIITNNNLTIVECVIDDNNNCLCIAYYK